MTIVVAAKLRNKVVVGADTLIVDGDRKIYPANFSKIVEISPELFIAFSGTTTVYHILKRLAKRKRKPKPPTDSDECFKLLKPILDEYKSFMLSMGKSDDTGIELMVATKYHIFTSDEFSCEEMKDYAAIGSGTDFALGSLKSSYPNSECIKNALDAATHFNNSCGGDFTIKELC